MNSKNNKENELEINLKSIVQISLVVFSMCTVLFLMFLATYDGNTGISNQETDSNVQAFEESDFYKIISYEISKSAGECASLYEKTSILSTEKYGF